MSPAVRGRDLRSSIDITICAGAHAAAYAGRGAGAADTVHAVLVDEAREGVVAHRQWNSERDVEHVVARDLRGRDLPVDLLNAALDRLRPCLADTRLSPRQRLQILWSGAVAARRFAARDVWGNEFARLVVETGLLRCLPRRSGAIIVCHVLRWAALGRNPW